MRGLPPGRTTRPDALLTVMRAAVCHDIYADWDGSDVLLDVTRRRATARTALSAYAELLTKFAHFLMVHIGVSLYCRTPVILISIQLVELTRRADFHLGVTDA